MRHEGGNRKHAPVARVSVAVQFEAVHLQYTNHAVQISLNTFIDVKDGMYCSVVIEAMCSKKYTFLVWGNYTTKFFSPKTAKKLRNTRRRFSVSPDFSAPFITLDYNIIFLYSS